MAKKSGGMSKVAMVRDAIAKLGWDVKVEEYHQYILDFDIPAQLRDGIANHGHLRHPA